MSFYRDRVLPRLIHWTMRQDHFTEYRERIVSGADGRVLEIGAGSGLNRRFYSPRVLDVIALDPSLALLSMGRDTRTADPPVAWIEGSAEAIPVRDHAVDTVLTTWTLCSIPNVASALDEARRVLKPSGKLLFVEHGRAPEASVSRWQDRLTPVWKRLAGGCHLNRRIDRLLEDAGFRLESLETGYMPGPRAMTFMYEGCARPHR